MKKFSFIHASDLHLDSPFKGVHSEFSKLAKILRSATFDAFEKLIQLCIDKHVHFLVIAGDIYDGKDRSLRAQLKFLDGVKRLAENNIRCFIVHGNHDPLSGWSSSIRWPENVHIFGSEKVETEIVNIKNEPLVAVSGISFQKRNEQSNLARLFQSRYPDLFQIGVLHCNCSRFSNYENYAPCTLNDLTSTGYDYWALGHVHERQILCSNPHVVYSGNTQGRNIREVEERGCYLVTVNGNSNVEISFHSLAVVLWKKVEVPIDNLESINEVESRLADHIQDLCEDSSGCSIICRITLTGRSPIVEELRDELVAIDLLERQRQVGLSLEPLIWVESIRVNCQHELNFEERRKSNDLLGQVLKESQLLRTLAEKKEEQRKDLGESLAPALTELFENRRLKRAINPLSEEDLKTILSEAEILCADLLEKSQ